MALVFWEGFDWGINGDWSSLKTNISGFNFAWDWSDYTNSPVASIASTSGRYGLSCLTPSSFAERGWGKITFNSSAPSEIYFGRASLIGVNMPIICVWGNSTLNSGYNNNGPSPDIWIEHYGQGALRIYNHQGGATITNSRTLGGGKNLIGTTSIGVLRLNTWQFIEVRIKASTSNTTADGIVEVWVEGNKVFSNTSCVTIANNSSTGYNGINTHIPINGTWNLDDVYITDTTGSAPWNTRLGDVRIASIVPNSDVPGANSGTPSTGTAHWSTVDELPYNTSDYVYIPNSSGSLERFNRTSLPTLSNTIFAIAPSMWVRKSDAGVANLHNILYNNSSGYQVNGNTVSVSTSYLRYRDSFSTNPETGLQWSNANVANLQLGVVVDP